MIISNPVSDCCFVEAKTKRFYMPDGSEAHDIELKPGEKEAICSKCKKDCHITQKPSN